MGNADALRGPGEVGSSGARPTGRRGGEADRERADALLTEWLDIWRGWALLGNAKAWGDLVARLADALAQERQRCVAAIMATTCPEHGSDLLACDVAAVKYGGCGPGKADFVAAVRALDEAPTRCEAQP